MQEGPYSLVWRRDCPGAATTTAAKLRVSAHKFFWNFVARNAFDLANGGWEVCRYLITASAARNLSKVIQTRQLGKR